MTQTEIQAARTEGGHPHWNRLAGPSHIALVGASPRESSLGFTRQLLSNNDLVGFTGTVSFVNPRHQEIAGRACYPSLDDVPGDIDVVAINTPASAVTGIVRQGLARGVRAFVVHAGDFAEGGPEGRERQEELQRLCRENGAILIGPNCLGVASVSRGACVLGSGLPADVRPGPVAIISQSGSVLATLLEASRNIGVSFVASTGNEAVTTTEDLLEGVLGEGDVRLVVLFLETLRRPEAFRVLAERALRQGVAIIAMKAGLSERGGAVSQTHTGSLASNGDAYRAFLGQLGVVLVEDFDDLTTTIALFGRQSPDTTATRARLGIIGTSGGKLAATADAAFTLEVDLPALSAGTVEQLGEVLTLPAGTSVDNPVDVGTGFRSKATYADRFVASLTAVAADPEVDVVMVQQDLACLAPSEMDFNREMVLAAIAHRDHLDAQLVVGSATHSGVDPALQVALDEAGVPTLLGTRPALGAIGRLDAHRRRVSAASQGSEEIGEAPSQTLRRGEAHDGVLEPQDARRLALDYDLPMVGSTVVDDPQDPVLDGLAFPVVVKVSSPDIVHKTEVNGVRLDVGSPEEVRTAMAEVLASARDALPTARLDGVEVSPQVRGFAELILGTFTDPTLGPVVVVGLGGIQAEALGSVSMLVPPFTHAQAVEALTSFAGHQVLQGFRGNPPADLDGIARHLQALGRLALDGRGWISSIDINPLVIGADHPAGVAVDLAVVVEG